MPPCLRWSRLPCACWACAEQLIEDRFHRHRLIAVVRRRALARNPSGRPTPRSAAPRCGCCGSCLPAVHVLRVPGLGVGPRPARPRPAASLPTSRTAWQGPVGGNAGRNISCNVATSAATNGPARRPVNLPRPQPQTRPERTGTRRVRHSPTPGVFCKPGRAVHRRDRLVSERSPRRGRRGCRRAQDRAVPVNGAATPTLAWNPPQSRPSRPFRLLEQIPCRLPGPGRPWGHRHSWADKRALWQRTRGRPCRRCRECAGRRSCGRLAGGVETGFAGALVRRGGHRRRPATPRPRRCRPDG
jgi:hypothetical protein